MPTSRREASMEVEKDPDPPQAQTKAMTKLNTIEKIKLIIIHDKINYSK